MIARLRDGSIGPPDDAVVGRYDARRVAQAFDQAVSELLRPAKQAA
jgi:hypothetical protein